VTAQTIAVARPACREDAASIARIYNQGIEDRIATFETDRRTTADIERLLDDRLGRYPAIVVERHGQVVAWASAGTYRARPCYDPIAEHSVYVDHGHCGIAVGRFVLQELFAEAEQLGFSTHAGEPHLSREPGQPDAAPQGRLHEIGINHPQGKLDGRWRNWVIVEEPRATLPRPE
jgi:L-amino acid N-acyltransferase YncA